MELKSDIKQVSGHYVLDHRKERSTDYYLVKCVKCGYESWRSNGFLKAKAICPQCSKGRHMHNAQGFGKHDVSKCTVHTEHGYLFSNGDIGKNYGTPENHFPIHRTL